MTMTVQEKALQAVSVTNWMSWEGGVDLVAMTHPELTEPNVIVHVARMVHTPVGSAPSGMVFYQPDPSQPPELFGFVSTNETVGAYFGTHIFAGTPFEAAPVIQATIQIQSTSQTAHAKLSWEGINIETSLSQLGDVVMETRPASSLPFIQQVLEAPSQQAQLTLNGRNIPLILPEVGISGGAPAVFSATGLYAR
jgi:hypothetical protein